MSSASRAAATVLAATTLLAAGAGSVRASDIPRIGMIDVPRVLEEYEGFKDATKALDKERLAGEQEYSERVKALQKLGKDFKDQSSMLSEAKRKEKQADLEKKAQDLEEWRQTKSKELQEKQEGLMKRLEADVRAALARIGADGKFAFVVRKDFLLYVDKSAVDLTDSVLTELRKQSTGK